MDYSLVSDCKAKVHFHSVVEPIENVGITELKQLESLNVSFNLIPSNGQMYFYSSIRKVYIFSNTPKVIIDYNKFHAVFPIDMNVLIKTIKESTTAVKVRRFENISQYISEKSTAMDLIHCKVPMILTINTYYYEVVIFIRYNMMGIPSFKVYHSSKVQLRKIKKLSYNRYEENAIKTYRLMEKI